MVFWLGVLAYDFVPNLLEMAETSTSRYCHLLIVPALKITAIEALQPNLALTGRVLKPYAKRRKK